MRPTALEVLNKDFLHNVAAVSDAGIINTVRETMSKRKEYDIANTQDDYGDIYVLNKLRQKNDNFHSTTRLLKISNQPSTAQPFTPSPEFLSALSDTQMVK